MKGTNDENHSHRRPSILIELVVTIDKTISILAILREYTLIIPSKSGERNKTHIVSNPQQNQVIAKTYQ